MRPTMVRGFRMAEGYVVGSSALVRGGAALREATFPCATGTQRRVYLMLSIARR